MFPNPADGLCADRAHGTVGAARRRRNRRLRAFLKHERMTVAMNLATIQHHSYLKSGVVNVGVQAGSPLAPVTEYVAPAKVPPVYSTTTVTSDLVYPQFSSTAVEPSAPCVVGSLPPVEEFTGPVYDQVLQEHIAASELPENIAEIPVVQEQVIVQEIPHVIVPLPPVEAFTGPVYDPVHQVQIAAGEMAEIIAQFPVVHEQVLVWLRPERLVRSLSALSLSLPSLADEVAEVVDASCLAFLVRHTFENKKKDEAREVQAEWRRRRRKLKDEFMALLNLSSRSPLQQKRMEELVDMVDAMEA